MTDQLQLVRDIWDVLLAQDDLCVKNKHNKGEKIISIKMIHAVLTQLGVPIQCVVRNLDVMDTKTKQRAYSLTTAALQVGNVFVTQWGEVDWDQVKESIRQKGVHIPLASGAKSEDLLYVWRDDPQVAVPKPCDATWLAQAMDVVRTHLAHVQKNVLAHTLADIDPQRSQRGVKL